MQYTLKRNVEVRLLNDRSGLVLYSEESGDTHIVNVTLPNCCDEAEIDHQCQDVLQALLGQEDTASSVLLDQLDQLGFLDESAPPAC